LEHPVKRTKAHLEYWAEQPSLGGVLTGVPGALDKKAKRTKVSLESSAKRPTFHTLSDLVRLLVRLLPVASCSSKVDCLVVAANKNAQLYLAIAWANQPLPIQLEVPFPFQIWRQSSSSCYIFNSC
jgi:hypothetical protein